MTAFARQSDDTIPCPGCSPNPSEQMSGPVAGFYKAPTPRSLPPSEAVCSCYTQHPKEKRKQAPGWATRMTFEDSVKPCGRAELQLLPVCGAEHSAVPAPVPVEGSSPSACPVGPKRPPSAGLGSARLQMPVAGSGRANGDRSGPPVPKASLRDLGLPGRATLAVTAGGRPGVLQPA